jgi:hypothetical protein
MYDEKGPAWNIGTWPEEHWNIARMFETSGREAANG